MRAPRSGTDRPEVGPVGVEAMGPQSTSAVRAGDGSPQATNPTFLVLRMGKRPATGMSPLHDTKGPSHLDIVLRPRGRVGPPGRPRTFSGIRPGRSNRNAVKMAPRQRPSPIHSINRRKAKGRWHQSVFGEALHGCGIGFAEKWHGHLSRDHWTSSAGCRCHVVQMPMDQTRRRKDSYRKPSGGQCFPCRLGGS
jgi:hypothetical protein